MKKLFILSLCIIMLGLPSFAKKTIPVPPSVKLPAKYSQTYIDNIADEYNSVTNNELLFVALDMLKGTDGDFSRKAILGYNLSGYPIKIEFKDLASVNKAYANFDAVGWKRKKKLFIYINPKHQAAPPAALAALLSHEALHQDEYNSLSEETFAWTMEAVVWIDLLEIYPECNVESNALVKRENTLKKLFEKGNNSPKYIKKSVVTDPMAHRTDYPMELPEAVVYYIKAFKDPSRQENREIELFDSFDELSCKKINVNIAKNKQQGTSKTSREPNRHNVFKKRTIDRVVIPKLNNSVNTEQSKSSTFYKPKPKRPIIDVVDGKRVFRWSFSFSYPNLKPVVCKIFIENQRESSSVNFVAGPIFHDRDFKLIVYTTTQEKAEDMINKELKKLIAIGKIRAC